MKTVYLFNPETGEFQGPYDAQESPLEPGQFIIPTAATDTAPPVAAERQVALFLDGAWSLHADYRGLIGYDQTTGEASMITSIGELAPGLGLEPPPPTLSQQAGTALLEARDVALSCLMAGIAFPQVWQDYCATLRSIVSSNTGSLPNRPTNPAGI